MKSPALLPQIDDSLRRYRSDAGQFLQLFYIRDVQIDGFRRRIFFGVCHGAKNEQSCEAESQSANPGTLRRHVIAASGSTGFSLWILIFI